MNNIYRVHESEITQKLSVSTFSQQNNKLSAERKWSLSSSCKPLLNENLMVDKISVFCCYKASIKKRHISAALQKSENNIVVIKTASVLKTDAAITIW